MKKLLIIISLMAFFGCTSEESPDCFKSSGSQVTKIIELGIFSKLLINNEFNVILIEGPTASVKLTTGENIIDDIQFMINDGLLEIQNTIGCSWVRDYNFPIIEITHPALEYIEIIGGSTVQSQGILSYSNLYLKSKDSNGVFTLELASENVIIENNEITNYFIDGAVTNLTLNYTSGDSRFEGRNLRVSNAFIQHKSSNDIIINVSNELTGSIGSTGDLIYVGEQPALIEVTTNNRGRLIDGTD